MPEVSEETRRQHWAKTRSLTIVVLVIWAIFAVVLPWFAKELNSVSFLSFPLEGEVARALYHLSNQ